MKRLPLTLLLGFTPILVSAADNTSLSGNWQIHRKAVSAIEYGIDGEFTAIQSK